MSSSNVKFDIALYNNANILQSTLQNNILSQTDYQTLVTNLLSQYGSQFKTDNISNTGSAPNTNIQSLTTQVNNLLSLINSPTISNSTNPSVNPQTVINDITSGNVQTLGGAFLNDLGIALNSFVALNNDIQNQVVALMNGAFEFVETALEGANGANVPSKSTTARDALPAVVTQGFEIALGVYALSLAQSSIPTENPSVLLTLALFVQELYAVNQAVNAFTSNAVGAALSEPLRQYYNSIFQPMNYPIANNFTMLAKGILTEAEVNANLTLEGFTPDKIQNLINDNHNIIAPQQLVRLVRMITLSPQYITSVLQSAGFVGQDLQNMLQIIQLDGVRNQLDAFVQQVIADYADGFIGDVLFQSYLADALVQSNEQIEVTNVAGIRQFTTYIKQKIQILELAFEQGFIDATLLTQYLTNLGLPTQTINNIVTLELLKVGINPNELLLFPAIAAFQPNGLTFTVSIT